MSGDDTIEAVITEPVWVEQKVSVNLETGDITEIDDPKTMGTVEQLEGEKTYRYPDSTEEFDLLADLEEDARQQEDH